MASLIRFQRMRSIERKRTDGLVSKDKSDARHTLVHLFHLDCLPLLHYTGHKLPSQITNTICQTSPVAERP